MLIGLVSALDTSEALLYWLDFGILFLFMLGIFFIITRLPSSDTKDETGAILKINWLKYLRPVLWVLEWGIAMAIIFLAMNMSLEYMTEAMMGDFFFMIWQILKITQKN